MGQRSKLDNKLHVKRQIGSDRMRQPLPPVPRDIPERRVLLARLAIVATLVGWIGYLIYWFSSQFLRQEAYTLQQKFLAIIYLAMVTLLIFSSLAYLVSRLGYLYRVRQHRRTPRAVIDDYFSHRQPSLTAIVPSYREETRVIRSTLLSVALQEYPDIDVVLLIDDPPRAEGHNRDLLEGARALPGDIERLLAYPLERVRSAALRFEATVAGASASNVDTPTVDLCVELAQTYDFAVSWLELQAGSLPLEDHTDVFLKEQVFERLAADFSMTAVALREAIRYGRPITNERIRQLYARLINTFRVRLSSFERKRYASLSHEANKAMNLNSYIGLMGHSYAEVETLAGRTLVPTSDSRADLIVRDPDYVLTLDADSTLLPEYCLRLVHLLEQDEFSNVGVTQTPYSAYPGSATRLERIAGATTDIQHIVHQGLTNYSASFWVGANAVIRKAALDAVETVNWENGHPIRRYVSDRTAIEDTESSVDLVMAGWKIYNYPERLSYSATPPDFGSLAIQRRRWADGGLLILPKLRRRMKLAGNDGREHRFGEFGLRTNYLASITWTSVALVILLVFPFANQLVSPYLALLAVPYFWAMSTDLRDSGYRRSDIFRIYGFNLILIPVNLAGTASSLVQALTGEHGSFARTPKVKTRTVAPLLFVVAPYLLIGLTIYTLARDYYSALWNNAVFAGLNLVLATYAIIAYVGVRHSIEDIAVQIRPLFAKRAKKRKGLVPVVLSEVIAQPEVHDWESVLFYGPSEFLLDSQVKDRARVNDPGHRHNRGRSKRKEHQVSPTSTPRLEEPITLLQPILSLATLEPEGYEILNRIKGGSPLGFLSSFEPAEALQIESLLLDRATGAFGGLAESAWVTINLSHRYLLEGSIDRLEAIASTGRTIYFEISAHEHGDKSLHDLSVLAGRLPEGLLLSIDDTIPEYNSFQLFRALVPQMIKIDRPWIQSIGSSEVRQSLIEVTVRFAEQAGIIVVAEGIATPEELEVLQA
ncbi:MAG: glycosyltransferase family 2 protein, partial [Ferrimicrobium sp.]